jgi:hypothetical protein
MDKVTTGSRKKNMGSEAVGSQDCDSATIHAHGEGSFCGLVSEGEPAQAYVECCFVLQIVLSNQKHTFLSTRKHLQTFSTVWNSLAV